MARRVAGHVPTCPRGRRRCADAQTHPRRLRSSGGASPRRHHPKAVLATTTSKMDPGQAMDRERAIAAVLEGTCTLVARRTPIIIIGMRVLVDNFAPNTSGLCIRYISRAPPPPPRATPLSAPPGPHRHCSSSPALLPPSLIVALAASRVSLGTPRTSEGAPFAGWRLGDPRRHPHRHGAAVDRGRRPAAGGDGRRRPRVTSGAASTPCSLVSRRRPRAPLQTCRLAPVRQCPVTRLVDDVADALPARKPAYSPPHYPSPWMDAYAPSWEESHARAAAFVSQLTVPEKVTSRPASGASPPL